MNIDSGLQGLGGLGGISHGDLDRNQAAVYGPPPTMQGPTGTAEVGDVKATPPMEDAARVLAGARPRMRALYTRSLREDPTMKGHATFALKVAADGNVTAVDATNVSGLSPQLVEAMKRTLGNLTFSPPAKPSVVTATVTCAVGSP